MEDSIFVYLDSDDYSRLSSQSLSPEVAQLAEQLRDASKTGRVTFVFSSAHVSEMAPLEARYSTSAAARADKLVELCGRNALISIDRLIRAEVEQLRERRLGLVSVVSTDGTWFPPIEGLVTPVQQLEFARKLEREIGARAQNRSQRRAMKSLAVRQGKLRKNAAASLGNMDLSEVLKTYPMREKDAAVLRNFMIGSATAQEAERAFLETLRDPGWMMRWFRDHQIELNPISDWVRKPARRMIASVSASFGAMNAALLEASKSETKEFWRLVSPTAWENRQNETLCSIASSLLGDCEISVAEVDIVERYCPGIATCIRVATDSARNSIGIHARAMKESDWVDALHSMYAPYVSIFRADQYMAPIIRRRVERFGTRVVGKLEYLGAELAELRHAK